MGSVLQDWVTELPLREQGTLLTAVRGCDLAPKWIASQGGEPVPHESMERRVTAWIRWCFMNPADPREVGIPGAFFQSQPPRPWKPSALMHYPAHWLTHVMHALEVIAYRHPDHNTGTEAYCLYAEIVRAMHLRPETREAMTERLSEDRIALGEVVS